MLKRLAQDKIDSEVQMQHERTFNKKLKLWHKIEQTKNAYQMQKVDQQMMQFQRKKNVYEPTVHSNVCSKYWLKAWFK